MRFTLFILFPFFFHSQIDWKQKKLPDFENVYFEKIAEDSLQSTFFIAIKKNVIPHYHKDHSECIVVLSGMGEMMLGQQKINLRDGVQVSIPKNTVHSVEVKGNKPIKVISIQSPIFDGKDRYLIDQMKFNK
jgi:quercetin dioxygenase-like cupin family protein